MQILLAQVVPMYQICRYPGFPLSDSSGNCCSSNLLHAFNFLLQKAMKLTSSSRKQSCMGEILNLMSVDAQNFMDVITNLNILWSAPLQIIVAVVMLWNILGPSVFAGVGVLFLLTPLNMYIVNKVKELQVSI